MSNNPYEASQHTAAEPTLRQPFRFPWAALLAGMGVCVILVGLLLPATRTAKPAARRMQCSNNLKRIALALRNYHSEFGSLPPAYTVDATGNRLHSWRVLILPYLEEQSLYDSTDRTKPWDDPVNVEAGARMPSIYRCPDNAIESNRTTYQVIVAPDSCFPFADGRRFSEIADGLSDTVMVMETSPAEAVHWISPYDTDMEFVMGFGTETNFAHQSGTHAVFADGAAVFLHDEMDGHARRAIVSVNGGENLFETSE